MKIEKLVAMLQAHAPHGAKNIRFDVPGLPAFSVENITGIYVPDATDRGAAERERREQAIAALSQNKVPSNPNPAPCPPYKPARIAAKMFRMVARSAVGHIAEYAIQVSEDGAPWQMFAAMWCTDKSTVLEALRHSRETNTHTFKVLDV